ncbi:hypothetical protein [Cronobacter muytjensii]|uniref:hypothetical protein n=1 Tax=Cronobacter muytjensii TaxID=413501 RepID=UPI0029FD8A82|nr:hypothetical protein [Cronobacter muytjensii]
MKRYQQVPCRSEQILALLNRGYLFYKLSQHGGKVTVLTGDGVRAQTLRRVTGFFIPAAGREI